MTTEQKKVISKPLSFLFGGLSGIGATCIVQPIDLIKTRMQLAGMSSDGVVYKNSLDAAQKIIKSEGFKSLYKGYSFIIHLSKDYPQLFSVKQPTPPQD
jgi:solute carrier family 25 (mitochondrial oxoglutarate transporter), member 11